MSLLYPAHPALRRVASVVLCLISALFPVGAVYAHKFQVEPVSVILRPQDNFINAEFIGNVQDITQTVNVEDSEKRGDEFVPAVLKRMTDYLNQHLVISQGGEKLKGEVVNLRFNSQLDPTNRASRWSPATPALILTRRPKTSQ